MRTVFFGPPGTGKTTRLLNTIEELFDEGFEPQQLAVVSFTKKAAGEIKQRALARFPTFGKDAWRFWGTLHSISFKHSMLRRDDVLDQDAYSEIALRCGMQLTAPHEGYDGEIVHGLSEGDVYLFHYGLAESRMISPKQHYQSLPRHIQYDFKEPKFLYFCNTVNLYKKVTGLLDFNDMLTRAQQIGSIRGLKVAVIDEAQDMSSLQWAAALTLFSDCERIYVAGDDDQAIFEWSGADVRQFLEFAKSAHVTVLEQSWRVPPAIQSLARRVIERIQPDNRYPKNWHAADHIGIVRRFPFLAAVLPRLLETNETWMILARHNYLLSEVRDELITRGVPHIIRGRPLVNPKDVLAIRSYEALRQNHEISRENAALVYSYLRGNGVHIQRGYKQLPASTPEQVNWELLRRDYGLVAPRALPWFEAFLGHTGRKDWEKIIQVYRRILRHGEKLLESSQRVKLSSIHGAKGGEADNVLLIEGLSSRCVENYRYGAASEHRVQYVATTRARKNLFIAPCHATGRQTYPLPLVSEH